MSSTTSVPYDWIETLSPELIQLYEVPFLGNTPSFPFKNFGDKLAKYFEVEKLSLISSSPEWQTPETLLTNSEPLIFEGNIASLEGAWYWIISKENALALMNLLLKQEVTSELADPNFLEGFCQFAAIQALSTFSEVDFDKSLMPRLKKIGAEIALSTPVFSRDITISLSNNEIKGKFSLSKELYDSLKKKYSQREVNVSLPASLAEKLKVTLHLEVGKTTLSTAEWTQTKMGDLLLLDKCTLTQGEEKGRVVLTLNGKPLFRGKIKQGNIKILENPLYHEADEPMAKHPEDQNDEETENDLDSEFEDLEESEEETPEEESEIEGEFSEEEQPEEVSGVHEETSKEVAAFVPVNELPMNIIVEVGRVQVSVQKLAELQPGNILELNVHPENGVDLVINNRIVGKGEIIRIGEALGVRILDLA